MLYKMELCRYRDVLGKPREGVHKYRIGRYALFDIAGTMIGGCLVAKWMEWNKIDTMIGLFLLGIVLHRLFCVNTSLNVELGLGVDDPTNIVESKRLLMDQRPASKKRD